MIRIGNREVGHGNPTFIVAEMSANHLKNLDIALQLVEEAANCGVDAFKIQTLTPDTMTIDCENDYFIIKSGTPWDGRKLYDLYSETPLPYEWHEPIFQRCRELGLICFSTPYDITAADFLEQFTPEAFKIASFEIFDTNLIRHVARFGKPMIISTGMANIDDISDAVAACHDVGNTQVILLKCTSAYPAPLEEINLYTLPDIEKQFGTLTGISDHSLFHEVAIASVALGSCLIEKHFTLGRHLGGPDAGFSLEPGEFADLVTKIRNTEKLLGHVNYSLTPKAKANLVFARSLFFVRDLKAGEVITAEHVRSIRPGYGLKPKMLDKILGRKAKENISRGTPCSWELIV